MIATDVDDDNAQARQLLEESLARYRTLGFPRFVPQVLLSLGAVAISERDPARARDLLQESMTGMQHVGEQLGIHGALDTFGRLAIAEGQVERAVTLAGAAERLRANSGTRSWPVMHRTRARWLSQARRTLDEPTYAAAWDHGQSMSREAAIAYALDDHPDPRAGFDAEL